MEMLGRLALFGVAVSGIAFSSVNAQDVSAKTYTAEDVVQFMTKQKNMGLERKVCVGTKSECADTQSQPGFDMLLYFDLNSAKLTPEAESNLDKIAAALNDDRLRGMKFRVEGHTDATGKPSYNQRLSDSRAKSVAAFLREHNVTADRLTAVGLGEKEPRTKDPYDPSNRRVELKNAQSN
jgi:outer membrane protein OmpA-like peptidoglycan-associated protein